MLRPQNRSRVSVLRVLFGNCGQRVALTWLKMLPRLEPVSGDSRTGLRQHREFLPGKSLARSETEPGFFGHDAPFRATETGLPDVSCAKAPGS
jgi:hypothetical protein